MIRKYCKVRNHCYYTVKYRGAALSIFNLRYSIPKEIPFSHCHYHFIIKELNEDFEGEFSCLGENTEKCITFSIRIKKELKTTGEKGKKLIQKSYPTD